MMMVVRNEKPTRKVSEGDRFGGNWGQDAQQPRVASFQYAGTAAPAAGTTITYQQRLPVRVLRYARVEPRAAAQLLCGWDRMGASGQTS